MKLVTSWPMTLLLLLSYYKSTGQQDSLKRITQIYAEVGTLMTTTRTVPFWQRANQYGTVPLTGSLGTIRFGMSSDYRLGSTRRIDWGYGLEIVGNTSPWEQQLILPQAYVKARWKNLELYAGRRKTIIGLVDTVLTSGSYAMSGNALPLPTIQLGTRGYLPLRFTKGLISINATFNHAWFETANRQVSHTMLHQAAFYTRVGKRSWPVRLYAGLNHQAVWGGYSQALNSPPGVSNDGKLPSSFKAYLYVVAALTNSDLSVDGNVSLFDETNRIGNHLGSLDIGAEFDIGTSTVLIYRQNPYDTGAIWYLTTIADGLNGLSIRRNWPGERFISVDRGLFEFLFTGDQGGNQFVFTDPYRRGKVNYFNSSQFVDGWTTRGRTIGTPFLTPQGELYPWAPYGPIVNNRVSVLHLGLTGHAGKETTWLLKLSNSRNAGTYDFPFDKMLEQFSASLQIATSIHLPVLGLVQLNTTGAIDRGDLLPDATGFYIGLRKTNFSAL